MKTVTLYFQFISDTFIAMLRTMQSSYDITKVNLSGDKIKNKLHSA